MSETKTTWKEERIYLLIAAVLCAGIGLYVYFFLPREKTDLAAADLVSMNDLVLEAPPEFDKIKSKEYIRLRFKGYERDFIINDYDVNPVSKDRIASEIQVGDTLSAGMTKEQFGSIDDEGLFSGSIEINSLQEKGTEFLDLDMRNIKSYKGNWDALPALLYGCIMCLFHAGLSKRPKYSPEIVIIIGGLIILFITTKYF